MLFKHLRVRSKLMLGFALLAAVVLLVSGLSLQSLGRSNGRFTDYLASVGARERLATDLRGAAMQRAIAARNLVLVTADADRAAEAAAVTRADNDMKAALSRLDEAVKHRAEAASDERRLLAEVDRIDAAYRLVATDIIAKALAGEREAAVQKMNVECRPLLAQLLAAVAGFIGNEQGQAAEQVAQAQAAYEQDRAALLAVCIAAVASALGMGWLLARAIVTPLADAVKVAEAVASGDLGSRIVVDRRDETGQLLAALQRMNDSLVQMVGRVRQSADGIATASAEIATGNQDLSSRTEQQASALQETAASMQQMTGAVQQSADSARQASALAGSAAAAAGRGGVVVQRVVATMAEITEASRRIGDIIGTIDGIAFQTNILALNAAVEAARAGEQGRGFAVVAEEVRTLARRAAEAAREVKVLVGNSMGRVEAGSQLAGEAGGTMADLEAQVRGMSGLIGDIDTRTSEQSLGIGQVNQAVTAIDQGTQQNAALVEQSAAAAESLRQQAAGLLELVGAFRTPAHA